MRGPAVLRILLPMFQKLLLLAVVCLSIQSCTVGKQANKSPLPNMYSSLDALAAAVVGAIADSSAEKLKALCVTEKEYREVVWANLDSAETSHEQMPVERAWSWVERDVDKATRRYVAEFGNRDVRFLRLGAKKNVREYPNIKVHRGQRIVVTADGSDEQEWRLMNVVLEYKGWFKVIAYND